MGVGETSLRGQVAWFRHLGACGHPRLAVDGGFAVATGLLSNTENGVVAAPDLLGQPARLDLLLGWLRSRGVPGSLIMTEPITTELAQLLVQRGLVAENNGHVMGRALQQNSDQSVASRDVWEVSEVVDLPALRDSLSVYRADGWFEDPAELERRCG